MPLLKVDNLRTYFHTRQGVVRAVDGVSFEIAPGETLGLVGESGSGKSVAMLSLLGLVPWPGRIERGSARFDEVDLLRCSSTKLRSIRGRQIAMIFQDPMTALNPYMPIGRQVMEPLIVHEGCSRRDAHDRALAALKEVGIRDPAHAMDAYPHEFSGGMRQRVMIAMAIITKPRVLIADEPTTALDVTVQAQILDLIKGLQGRADASHAQTTAAADRMAVILVTHNLGVIAETCDRVLVMYAGKVMESAAVEELFGRPRHPYTQALMASLPSLHKRTERLYAIPGRPGENTQERVGCPFAPRCEKAASACTATAVQLREIASGHSSACLRVQAGEI